MRRRLRRLERDRFEHAYESLQGRLVERIRIDRAAVEAEELATDLIDEMVYGQSHLLQDLADPGGERWWHERAYESTPLTFPWFRYYPEGDEYGNNVLNVRTPGKGTLCLVTNWRVKHKLLPLHMEEGKA